MVYISPERIRDPRLKEALRQANNIVQVVVDEAHRDNQTANIYCSTVREAERLTRRLDTAGLIVRCYHRRLAEIDRI